MKIPTNIPWESTGRTLGRGGQGVVHEVTKRGGDPNERFALKILKNVKSQQAIARFSQEIRALQKISHPGVLKVLDHCCENTDFKYFVTPLLEDARTLQEAISTRPSPYIGKPIEALQLFEQICEALNACHTAGITHRDLKPANILLSRGQAYLIDFGICHVIDGDTITLIDEGVGSPKYMAPECESGSEAQVNATADIYSVGKILWAALTGREAFAREAPAFTNLSLQQLFPDNPRIWHLQRIFEKTIRRNPEERWANARDALTQSRRLQYIIESGFPPAEYLGVYCGICGVGKLKDFHGSHMVFGNPNPSGIRSLQCDTCGYCVAINTELRNKVIEDRRRLE